MSALILGEGPDVSTEVRAWVLFVGGLVIGVLIAGPVCFWLGRCLP